MDITPYLKLMASKRASDLFFSTNAPVYIKIEGQLSPVTKEVLPPGLTREIAYSIMDERQKRAFEETLEMNLGLSLQGIGRFRINIFKQRGEVAIVVRYITFDIPDIHTLNLPPVLNDLAMEKRGLILLVGGTGTGKSTTLAAMLDHRNTLQSGHILTIEDPIEYLFRHKRALVDQRELGIDTLSYENALKNAMREAPDVIMIGEIRDQYVMRQAIIYAETGHLCLSTLHANNSYQALSRIINFFPPEAHAQLLMDLSLNLKAIISQRLIPGVDGKRVPAVEVLINTPYISELIQKGAFGEVKKAIAEGHQKELQSFDASLFELYKAGKITKEDALAYAESRTNLEWRMTFGDQKR